MITAPTAAPAHIDLDSAGDGLCHIVYEDGKPLCGMGAVLPDVVAPHDWVAPVDGICPTCGLKSCPTCDLLDTIDFWKDQ